MAIWLVIVFLLYVIIKLHIRILDLESDYYHLRRAIKRLELEIQQDKSKSKS